MQLTKKGVPQMEFRIRIPILKSNRVEKFYNSDDSLAYNILAANALPKMTKQMGNAQNCLRPNSSVKAGVRWGNCRW